MDGTVYEVAGRAVAQLRSLEKLIELSLSGTEAMVRNAQMERDLEQTGTTQSWENSPQGRVFARLRQNNSESIRALTALERAAAYDPRET